MLILGRPVRYLVAGAWNTVFGLAAFTLLQLAFGDWVGYVVTLAIAQVVAVIQAHAVQRHYVWRSRQPYLGELKRFSVIYAIAYLANVILLVAAVEIAGAPVLPAQYVVGGAIILASYFAQRGWAFRASRDGLDPADSQIDNDLRR